MEVGTLPITSYPCSLCGASNSRVVLRKAGIRETRVFDVVACNACGHIYVNPRIADEALPQLYDDDYYRGRGFDRSIDYTRPPSAQTRMELSVPIQTIEKAAGQMSGLRWLDFGCGAGFLLEELLGRGANAVGFDDSSAAKRQCTERRLPLMTIAQIEAARGYFDVVSAIEVIEHVPDPRAFLRYLVSFLKIGGIAYIQTGNWNVVRRLPRTPYIMPEGHIHYFTPPELRRLFFEVGLDEVPVFNYSWFPWRDLLPAVRRLIPRGAFFAASAAAKTLAPNYAPFPIGKRVL